MILAGIYGVEMACWPLFCWTPCELSTQVAKAFSLRDCLDEIWREYSHGLDAKCAPICLNTWFSADMLFVWVMGPWGLWTSITSAVLSWWGPSQAFGVQTGFPSCWEQCGRGGFPFYTTYAKESLAENHSHQPLLDCNGINGSAIKLVLKMCTYKTKNCQIWNTFLWHIYWLLIFVTT